ncbi:unnamed protein product [Ilex paraguariensis]|uniref:Uncharacterized protein n=1 Tax=Ilex paraguariensis TaxID=185542 RepID=A0ABC8S663_9AQUA
MSSFIGATESSQHSMSSGPQITNLSLVSTARTPPLSSSSFERKCSLMGCMAAKSSTGSPGSGLRLPETLGWRKYSQKPIKGAPTSKSLLVSLDNEKKGEEIVDLVGNESREWWTFLLRLIMFYVVMWISIFNYIWW